MQYDLVIKNGLVVDGSGGPAFHSDIGVIDGKIAMIGRIPENGSETIDAEGHVVSPGFVDGHTHMDAQVFWDNLGTSSCYHGITSAVMGNCGFTLAPCREAETEMVFRNLERAEDISAESMKAGIKWSWETYPEYLDAIDALPKGINYAGYIGHSALRSYVMGERSFTEQATEDELASMAHNVQEAVRAGAIGFSTSRIHQLYTDQPVASAVAEWSEVRTIVNAMSKAGAGVFELAGEQTYRDPVLKEDYFGRQLQLAVESGVPYTWGLISSQTEPQDWRYYLQLLEDTAAAGGRMFAQVHTRALNVLSSFESRMPFDNWDHWREIRTLPLDEQKVKLKDPAIKAKLVDIATDPGGKTFLNQWGTYDGRPPNWDRMLVMDTMEGEHRRLSDVAAERGVRPAEAMIDLALEHDLKLFFRRFSANESDNDVIAMMKHPHTVVTFSDSGAHVGMIMDSSLQTHLFSHWMRKKQAVTLEEAVRMVTYEPSARWGLHDRGLLRMGLAADILVFDPDTIGANLPTVEHDLPGGSMRLKQTAHGIAATIVNGQILLRNNEHTGAQPGQVLRGPLARTST
jgi:N-acyl-D-amino-acid deacylase